MSTIWVVGSLNVDLVVGVDRFPEPGETLRGNSFSTFLGGKGGNQAVAVARLGAHPRMVGRLGSDQFGRRYREALDALGARTDLIGEDPDQPTGTALIEVDARGQNRIVIVPGANGTMDETSTLAALADLAPGDLVLLQLEIPLATVWKVIEFAHDRGAVVILDPAPAAEIPPETLRLVTWITPNESEAAMITGTARRETVTKRETDDALKSAARRLLESGVDNALVKAGPRGAYLATREQPDPVHLPGFSVDVVDTTAAGDAFNGGLAWALSRGAAPQEAVRTANAVGALAVTGPGAQTAMPHADAVAELLHVR